MYLPGVELDPGIAAAAEIALLGDCDVVLLVCPAQAVREEHVRHIAAFPLAIPLMAGPGAITATLLLSGRLREIRPPC